MPTDAAPTDAAPTATTVDQAQHGLTKHSHGAGVVPVQTRSERFASTKHADFPPVTGRESEWKLTPVRLLEPLIDGALDGSPYEISVSKGSVSQGAAQGSESQGAAQQPGVSIEWIGRDDAGIGRAGTAEERAAANAWSGFERALSITVTSVPADAGGIQPVTVTRAGLGDAPRAAHTLITAKPNSDGLIILQSTGTAQLSENVEIVVEDGARLTVVSVQEWDSDAIHLASHFARIGHGASLKHIVVSLGGKVVRVNPSAHLAEEGAEVELFGVYFADADQHLEQRVYVNHDAPHTRSRVNYKGALNGAGARTVWVGDVLIGRTAPGTDSYEQNRNLVLSDGTRADSIPNLEIETGDIAGAGHASATGRFDDEQLFYLGSRGIPEAEARRLVVLGFLAEIVQKIGQPELEGRLEAAIEAELEAAVVR